MLWLRLCLLQRTWMATGPCPRHRQPPVLVAGGALAPDGPPTQANDMPHGSLQMRTVMPDTNALRRGPLSAGGLITAFYVHVCRIFHSPLDAPAQGNPASSQRLSQTANNSTDASNVSPESKQVSSRNRPSGSRSTVADCQACVLPHSSPAYIMAGPRTARSCPHADCQSGCGTCL